MGDARSSQSAHPLHLQGISVKQASDNLTRAARSHGIAQFNQRPKMRTRPGWEGMHRITIAGHAQELFDLYVSGGEMDPYRALRRRCLPNEQWYNFTDEFYIVLLVLVGVAIFASVAMLAIGGAYALPVVVAFVGVVVVPCCCFVYVPTHWIGVLLTKQARYERQLLKAMRNIQDHSHKHMQAAQQGDLSIALDMNGGELTQCSSGQLEVIDE